MQASFKFCSACGAQNNLGAQFCQSCGLQYANTPTPTPQFTEGRPRLTFKSLLLIICVAPIIGCCALAGIGSMFSSRSDKTPATGTAPAPTASKSSPLWSPTPDLPPSELLSRAKALLAQPYDASAYGGAIDLLNRIPSAAKEHKESIPLKRKAIKARERETAAAESAARKQGAYNVERGLLSKGYDATVTVSGPENRTIRITYVLMNRPTVYQLVEGGFLDQLRAQGFRKVIFSDGYGSTWWYNL